MADGYHFGNFGRGSLQMTWARLMKNRYSNEIITVLNQRVMNFSTVNSSDITFQVEERMLDQGEIIPKKCSLRINSEQIQVNVTMETLDIHCIKIVAMRYLRYHLKAYDTIKIGSLTEEIDNVEISELLAFFKLRC